MDVFNIFLADDDEDDRFTFAMALENIGEHISLISCSDGEELINSLHSFTQNPDLIILDNNMPKKDGLTCLAEIRSIERFDDTPVVIFSTSADAVSVRKAQEYGANHYIQKPHNLQKLRQVIQFCIDIDLNAKEIKHPFLINL